MDASTLVRKLSRGQRDALLEQAIADYPSLAAAARAMVSSGSGSPVKTSGPSSPSAQRVDYSALPAPALELIARHLMMILRSEGEPGTIVGSLGRGSPVAAVLATLRRLRATCRTWGLSISAANTVSELDLGPQWNSHDGKHSAWWSPTYSGCGEAIVVRPVAPQNFTRQEGAQEPDPEPEPAPALEVACRVKREVGSGRVRLEVVGSAGGQLPTAIPSALGFNRTSVTIRPVRGTIIHAGTVGQQQQDQPNVEQEASVVLDRGEAPWSEFVPFPWPDFGNINPRPIFALPLPPRTSMGQQFASLETVSLYSLYLGCLVSVDIVARRHAVRRRACGCGCSLAHSVISKRPCGGDLSLALSCVLHVHIMCPFSSVVIAAGSARWSVASTTAAGPTPQPSARIAAVVVQHATLTGARSQ